MLTEYQKQGHTYVVGDVMTDVQLKAEIEQYIASEDIENADTDEILEKFIDKQEYAYRRDISDELSEFLDNYDYD